MTPTRIWQFALRWWWLFVLASVVAGGGSYVVSSRLPKVYQGDVELLVRPSGANGTASYSDVMMAESLTSTYAEVLKTRPVIEPATQQAGLDLPYETAAALVDVKPVHGTQLIQISARANDPTLAAGFANALANVFIQQTQASQSARFETTKQSISSQVDQLAAEIADRNSQLDALRGQPVSAARDADLARVQSDVSQLQQTYSTAARSLQDVRMSQALSTDLLEVVQPAIPSANPVQPRIVLNVALAALIGLLLAFAAGFLVDYLDDRVLSPERLGRLTGLHVLGSVSVLPAGAPHMVDQLAATESAEHYTFSSTAESFRLLGTNLKFAAVERPLQSLLVTSSDAGDGKTTTAANMAIVAAQAGQRVILVDADLRRPSLHHMFEVSNRTGLTSLLINQALPASSAILQTRIDGLSVIPSGPLPPNPSELLASQHMKARLDELRGMAELIIIDSPPARPVSDPAVLAGMVDGTVLVVNAQRTRGAHAVHVLTTLRKAGGHVLGAVLNRTAPAKRSAYGYYTRQSKSSQPVVTPS